MNESLIQWAFSPERAAIYDQQFVGVRAIKDLMHLVIRVRFSGLPSDARILVAGAGTGAEVRFLAPLFTGWRFTLVDPAEGMLAIARRHAEAENFIDRCTFHRGYVSTSPEDSHDAATSILVSHFLAEEGERRQYFKDIAARLKPGGLLFNADLATEHHAASFGQAMDLWMQMIEHSNQGGEVPRFLPTEQDSEPGQPSYHEMFGKEFAVHGPAEVEAMIEQAGFRDLLPCYQAVFIRAWLARRG